jgi:hypothetical protein
MAGDSERRCVLSIIERGMVLFIRRPFYWFAGFHFFAVHMMISYLGIGTRGRDFDYPRHQELHGVDFKPCGYISSNLRKTYD